MHFPFTAVAGQSSFKLALTLAAIDAGIGGVLISGPRGSAKSTLARGMADILPPAIVTEASEAQRPTFVTLPLGATTDMVVGTLNLEQILAHQRAQFQPGLLARADGGVLYVDEVNLLPDHLVDLLLDVSSSGINIVERDGVSHQHRAQFVLLGTMNPDEGELRAQLQDRFGLSVQLSNRYSTQERMDIVRLREAFDDDPESFVAKFAAQQQALTKAIEAARIKLPAVQCSDALREFIANACTEACVDGLRADIVWLRAARARAAYCGRTEVDSSDITSVAELVLEHRRNPSSNDSGSSSPEEQGSPDSFIPPGSAYTRPPMRSNDHPDSRGLESGSTSDTEPGGSSSDSPSDTTESDDSDWGQMPPQVQAVSSATLNSKQLPWTTRQLRVRHSDAKRASVLSETPSASHGSNFRGSVASSRDSRSINWFSTLMSNAGQWPLKALRYRRARTGSSALHLILLDTSASTLQSRWFSQAKGVALDIAKQAYLAREQLAIIGFGNQEIQMLLPRKRAPKSLKLWLDTIPAAGGTPMRQILEHALQYQQSQNRRTSSIAFKTYLVTDGRSSQSFKGLSLLGDVLVIDIEQSAVKRGRAHELSHTLDATYWALPA